MNNQIHRVSTCSILPNCPFGFLSFLFVLPPLLPLFLYLLPDRFLVLLCLLALYRRPHAQRPSNHSPCNRCRLLGSCPQTACCYWGALRLRLRLVRLWSRSRPVDIWGSRLEWRAGVRATAGRPGICAGDGGWRWSEGKWGGGGLWRGRILRGRVGWGGFSFFFPGVYWGGRLKAGVWLLRLFRLSRGIEG